MNTTVKAFTNEELFKVYEQFLSFENEPINGIPEYSLLGKLRQEYEEKYGVNCILTMQLELTHEIANRWYYDQFLQ